MPPTMVRRATGVTAVIAALLTAVTPAQAGGRPSTRPGSASLPEADLAAWVRDKDKLAKLEKQANKLAKEYRGSLADLSDAKRAAKDAAAEAARLNGRFAALRVQVARLAAVRYMSGDMTLIVLGSGDPERALADVAAIEQAGRTQAQRVQALARLAGQARAARQRAEAQTARLAATLQELTRRRARVQKLLDTFKPQSPLAGDRVTARMRSVRAEVDRRFGPFTTIGCYRPNAGEHTQGRACDFMLAAGVMPSARQVQRGYDAANWARANASRLGVMYIIYRQRIWDSRRGGGWRPMEDRGSITANHYDHVHVSVF